MKRVLPLLIVFTSSLAMASDLAITESNSWKTSNSILGIDIGERASSRDNGVGGGIVVSVGKGISIAASHYWLKLAEGKSGLVYRMIELSVLGRLHTSSMFAFYVRSSSLFVLPDSSLSDSSSSGIQLGTGSEFTYPGSRFMTYFGELGVGWILGQEQLKIASNPLLGNGVNLTIGVRVRPF